LLAPNYPYFYPLLETLPLFFHTAPGPFPLGATTFWFRFKDDVVIRVKPLGKESRIDLRSVSRLGKGDLGANAKRIREFLNRLKPPSED
jgi:hypothetical protein